MRPAAVILLAALGCRPSLPSLADRVEGLYSLCASLPADEVPFRAGSIVAEMDSFMLQALNSSAPPLLGELRRLLDRRPIRPPYPLVLACDRLEGSDAVLVVYSVLTSASAAPAQVRIFRDNRLVRPSPHGLAAAQAELAIWRGGDFVVRYGGSLRLGAFAWEDCATTLPPIILDARYPRLALEYRIPGTCPSTFFLVWECGSELRPIGYSWHEWDSKGWRRFGETPLAELSDYVRRISVWEGK